MQRLVLIDGLNLVRRIFEARGGVAGAEFVNASSQSVQRCLEDLKPTHAVVVWDSAYTTWRHELDERYKANRPPTPAELLFAVPDLNQAFEALGVSNLTVPKYEADDVIATMATAVAKSDAIEAVVVSTDKMFSPLMLEGTKLYHQFDRSWITPEQIEVKYGLKLNQLEDYWALSGDNSNNIKGVPGIGKKTATELLQTHNSIEGIFEAGVSNKLNSNMPEAELCRQLVALKRDVEVGVNLREFRISRT